QLYRLKHEMPDIYARTHLALHLPQYLSFLLTQKTFSDITSIGCHTGLWDFKQQRYHRWVQDNGLDKKLAPIVSTDHTEMVNLFGKSFLVGVGLHDSSAALVPYLRSFQTPFALLSTGTWCITLNPFNHHPLTDEELSLDCLAYMSYQHQQVKASRLFAGQLHEIYLGKIADHFGVDPKIIQSIEYDPAWAADWRRKQPWETLHSLQPPIIENLYFSKREISAFNTVKEAYHALVMDLVALQTISSRLVLNGTQVQHLYVDGGFSKNQIFLSELSASFSNINVCRMEIAQASALGAAMAIS
ncbi:MAG: carbohydrate kinase, partial [Flavihumibacter sp.]|nr:carbohydrate kinase [Flavihumibacter sp.]